MTNVNPCRANRVVRTTCCPDARSAQEVAGKYPLSLGRKAKSEVTSCGLRPPGQQVVQATQKIAPAILGAFVLTACSSAVTPDKMAQIKPAMKADQVEALLGRPARIEQSETTGLTGEVDYYPASNGEGRVIFLNNLVFKADFVPGARKS